MLNDEKTNTRYCLSVGRWLIAGTAMSLFALIPFSCSQGILRSVTPYLLDDSNTILDQVIRLVAPLVLP